VNHFSG